MPPSSSTSSIQAYRDDVQIFFVTLQVDEADGWFFHTRSEESFMSVTVFPEIRVSLDIGCRFHSVAVGLADGSLLDEFEIQHTKSGFKSFFSKIQGYELKHKLPVSIAMEGYNGYARPLDQMIRARNYRLFNINNLKLARFKEIFPGAAKTDALDARKGLELFQLRDHLPLAKDVLQEIKPTPIVNDQLKRLTRRRRRMVTERVSVINSLQSDLHAVCPGLCDITQDVSQVWYLNFLSSTKNNLTELSRKRYGSLIKIKGIGKVMVEKILPWQQQACFSPEVELVSPLILEDVNRIIELNNIIKMLDRQIEVLATESTEATLLRSIPGFGKTSCSEIAGELGTVKRFSSEASLALYLGMATLDNSSGNYRGSKAPKHVNTRAKAAMMAAVDHHRREVEESKRYYEKKRAEGKRHNQAIRALGRHLCRVIFKMLKDKKTYENK
jgi:transposase